MLTINIITLFPQLFEPHFAELPFKKALTKNLIKFNLINLRDFAIDKHLTVDDKPYGGGVGMVLMLEPIYNAVKSICEQNPTAKYKMLVMTPKGEIFTQQKAAELAQLAENTADYELILFCGRYEGFDARIFALDKLLPNLEIESVSIGKYVLSGGELPALVVLESTTRLLAGVLEKPEAIRIESFSQGDEVEFPQYTRPENFKGLKVPNILLSGNHNEIAKWRSNQTTV